MTTKHSFKFTVAMPIKYGIIIFTFNCTRFFQNFVHFEVPCPWAIKRPLTVTNNNHNFLLPAYFGGLKKTSRVMGWPFKKAKFISGEFIFYLFGTILVNINREFYRILGSQFQYHPFQFLQTPTPHPSTTRSF